MLMLCPECNLQVSDKAFSCPHCGYPLKPEKAARQTQPKRMRLPNGFGQISKISNRNLRNPWRVMVSVGKDANGRPIQKTLKPKAYFKTYNEAYEALVKYHKNPYDLTDDTTLEELYERWSRQYFESLASTTIAGHKLAWSYCSMLYDKKVRNITKRDLRNLYDNASAIKNGKTCHPTPNIKVNMKQLLMLMFDYAVEYDLVETNLPKNVSLPKADSEKAHKTKHPHTDFTSEELDILWQHTGETIIDMMLVDCYMGWRPQELCKMTKDQVNISEMTITGGMKTESGKDRIVPVHPLIQDIIKRYYETPGKTLFGDDLYQYHKYKYYFDATLKKYNLDPGHRPHDCRVTFVSLCKKYQVDEYAIKRLVGHSITDITEAVYTVRGIDWLRDEVKKIRRC